MLNEQIKMLQPVTLAHVAFFLFVGMYPLRSINKRLAEIIEACYSGNGVINGKPTVYMPYSSKPEDCRSSNQVRNSRLHVTDKREAGRGREIQASNSTLNVKFLRLVLFPCLGRKTWRSSTVVEPSSCRPHWPVKPSSPLKQNRCWSERDN